MTRRIETLPVKGSERVLKTSAASGPPGALAGVAGELDRIAADVGGRESGAVERRGQVRDEGVEQRRGADAVGAGAQGEGEDLAGPDGRAQAGLETLLGERALL